MNLHISFSSTLLDWFNKWYYSLPTDQSACIQRCITQKVNSVMYLEQGFSIILAYRPVRTRHIQQNKARQPNTPCFSIPWCMFYSFSGANWHLLWLIRPDLTHELSFENPWLKECVLYCIDQVMHIKKSSTGILCSMVYASYFVCCIVSDSV